MPRARATAVNETPPPAPWPPEWAFVVQVHPGTRFAPSLLHGRIEHVTTGHAALFNSLEEARAFMEAQMAPGTQSPP